MDHSPFIARERELAILQSEWDSKKSKGSSYLVGGALGRHTW